MGSYSASVVVIIVSVCLVLLVRRNLRQRPMARRYRAIFVNFAEELVGDPDFPDAHAKQLTDILRVPEGWLTRFMVFKLLQEMLLGRGGKKRKGPDFKKVPEHLRPKYIAALFALAIGDSYRCVILGRVWRGANLWILDAIKEPAVDVNAHATKRVIEQVSGARPRHYPKMTALEECVPA